MDGHWDCRTRIVLAGLIVPTAILLLVAFNIATGTVYWPPLYPYTDLVWGVFTTFDDAWRVAGTVLAKVAVGSTLFCHFVVGNSSRFGQWSRLCVLVSAGLALVGLGLVAAGYLL